MLISLDRCTTATIFYPNAYISQSASILSIPSISTWVSSEDLISKCYTYLPGPMKYLAMANALLLKYLYTRLHIAI